MSTVPLLHREPFRRAVGAESPPGRTTRTARLALFVLCSSLVTCVGTASHAGAASDVGARHVASGAVGGDARITGRRYTPPVDAPVVDSFRLPAGPYGPGNRGLEYATPPGAEVRSIDDGRVAFAGQVGGRLVVSIDHPDGLRSSLVGPTVLKVQVGDRVVRGQVVGRSGRLVHLGVRRAGVYLDPATLFAPAGPAILVPLGRAPLTGVGFGPSAGGH